MMFRIPDDEHLAIVMPGLVPGIHDFFLRD